MKIYRMLAYVAAFVIVSFGLVNFYLLSNNLARVPENYNSKRIMLVAQVNQNEYWQEIKKGAEDAAKNRGCVIEYEGPQTSNINESIDILKMGVAIEIDGIITYVQQEKQYIPIIKKAALNGISVITIDADALNSDRIAYVGTDNLKAGYAAGRQLAEITDSNANIGIIMSGGTTTSETDKVNGFKECIDDIKKMKIVSVETSNSDILKAQLVAKKIIDTHPEINALYCTSSIDGIGAARAVINTNNKGRIKIVCFDDLPETIRFIKDDTIQVSIVQKPNQMGYDSVNAMMDKLEGKKIKSEYLTGIIVVNKSNVSNYNMVKGEMN